jgi:hypothetical protein
MSAWWTGLSTFTGPLVSGSQMWTLCLLNIDETAVN